VGWLDTGVGTREDKGLPAVEPGETAAVLRGSSWTAELVVGDRGPGGFTGLIIGFTAVHSPRQPPAPSSTTAGTFDVTAGYPTAKPLKIGSPFTGERLPGGRIVHVLHLGPWSTLLSTYDRLSEWLVAHRLSLVPLMWEEYLVGPDTVADPAAWRTRIVVPLPTYQHRWPNGSPVSDGTPTDTCCGLAR
jgi:hypothetical protein